MNVRVADLPTNVYSKRKSSKSRERRLRERELDGKEGEEEKAFDFPNTCRKQAYDEIVSFFNSTIYRRSIRTNNKNLRKTRQQILQLQTPCGYTLCRDQLNNVKLIVVISNSQRSSPSKRERRHLLPVCRDAKSATFPIGLHPEKILVDRCRLGRRR